MKSLTSIFDSAKTVHFVVAGIALTAVGAPIAMVGLFSGRHGIFWALAGMFGAFLVCTGLVFAIRAEWFATGDDDINRRHRAERLARARQIRDSAQAELDEEERRVAAGEHR